MKIAIINFQHSNYNYGAVLQAAALSYCINDLDENFVVEHLDFQPQKNYKILIKRFIRNTLSMAGLMKGIEKSQRVEHHGHFERFRNEWLTRSKLLISSRELSNQMRLFDTVIVGSDQVWRPEYTGVNAEDYFLMTCPETVRKVAYAASFGKDIYEDPRGRVNLERLKSTLSSYNGISVREESGLDICCNTFNIPAVHVVDPTILAGKTFFDEIIKNEDTTTADFVYYKLDKTEEFDNCVSEISQYYGYTCEDIYYNDSGYHSMSFWIKSIKQSKLIVTDSFHCVCLAIIYNKNFFCISNAGRGTARLESLLSSVGLESRFIDESNLISSAKSNEDIDYEYVNKKLSLMRGTSLNFLEKSLSIR